MSGSEGWFIVLCIPQRTMDMVAAFNEAAREVVAYSPLVWRMRRVGGVRRPVLVPEAAYPGYVFLAVRRKDVLLTRPLGWCELMMKDGVSVMVDDEEIERVRLCEVVWMNDTRDAARTSVFAPGCDVAVKAGLFTGRSGRVVSGDAEYTTVTIGPMRLRIFTRLLRGKSATGGVERGA